MMLRLFFRALTLFALVLLLIVPILGQEVATPAAVVPELPEVVQVVVPPEGAAAPDTESVRVNLVQVIIGLLSAFAAGGIIGIAGLSIFVQRLQRDTQTVTALELLANSWPPQTRELLLSVAKGAKKIS